MGLLRWIKRRQTVKWASNSRVVHWFKRRWIVRWMGNSRLVRWIKMKLGFVDLPPLREFVYLDESSLISLLASTTGGITDQQSTRQRKRISGSITGILPGNQGDIGATKEKTSEIVRQYVIQSNFTEFYELRKGDLKLSDQIKSNSAIPLQGTRTTELDGFEVSDSELKRGDMIELEVELGSHDLYKIYKAVDLLGEIIESLPDDSDPISEIESEEFSGGNVSDIIELIGKFLIGLVPIEGEVENYGVVKSDSQAYIGEKSVLEKQDIEYDSFSIVGSVKESAMWQDTTRFLFDENEYTAYCRIDDPQLEEDWMPLKLMDVVDGIEEGASESIQQLPNEFDLDDDSGSSNTVEKGRKIVNSDIKIYLSYISDLDDDTINQVANDISSRVETDNLQTEDREQFMRLSEEAIEQEEQLDIDEVNKVRIIGNVITENDVDTQSGTDDTETDWYLKVDFVSIYW